MKVLHKQSLIDVSIQASGTADHLIDLAVENEISPTDFLEVGSELTVPNLSGVNSDVVGFFGRKNITIATAVNQTDQSIIIPVTLSCQDKIEQCFK